MEIIYIVPSNITHTFIDNITSFSPDLLNVYMHVFEQRVNYLFGKLNINSGIKHIRVAIRFPTACYSIDLRN